MRCAAITSIILALIILASGCDVGSNELSTNTAAQQAFESLLPGEKPFYTIDLSALTGHTLDPRRGTLLPRNGWHEDRLATGYRVGPPINGMQWLVYRDKTATPIWFHVPAPNDEDVVEMRRPLWLAESALSCPQYQVSSKRLEMREAEHASMPAFFDDVAIPPSNTFLAAVGGTNGFASLVSGQCYRGVKHAVTEYTPNWPPPELQTQLTLYPLSLLSTVLSRLR
jgi:hypothetical protein